MACNSVHEILTGRIPQYVFVESLSQGRISGETTNCAPQKL